MTEQRNPEDLLDFPCHYQFKALGTAGIAFQAAVVTAIEEHVQVNRDAVKSRLSGKGNYQSVSVLVTLQGYAQLKSIYAELRQIPGLKTLL